MLSIEEIGLMIEEALDKEDDTELQSTLMEIRPEEWKAVANALQDVSKRTENSENIVKSS